MFGWGKTKPVSASQAKAEDEALSRQKIFIACPYQVVPILGYLLVFERLRASFDEEPQSSPKLVIAKDFPTHKGLEQSIVEHVKTCDYGIYDLSGNPPNLNVVYEIGIARGLDKKRFIIRKDLDTDGLPADLMGEKIHKYSTKQELENTIHGIIFGEFEPKKRVIDEKAIGEQTNAAVLKAVIEGNNTTSAIAGKLNLPAAAVRSILANLEEDKKISSSGARRGKIYRAYGAH